MTSKDPISSVLGAAVGAASSALTFAASQMRHLGTETAAPAAPAAPLANNDFALLLEREGVVRQEELAALRRIVMALQTELTATQAQVKKLKKKLQKQAGPAEAPHE